MLETVLLSVAALSTQVGVQFTANSPYTDVTILNVDAVKQDDGKYTLLISQNNRLGYQIYDDQTTFTVEGLLCNSKPVESWKVPDVVDDPGALYVLTVRTIYTNDVAGMFAAAKDGDWSKALSNPLILFQLIYYILAGLSVIVGGVGLARSKKSRVKTADDIAKAVDNRAEAAVTGIEKYALTTVDNLVSPVYAQLRSQQQDIIRCLILMQQGDSKATLELLDLLKNASSEDVAVLTESVKATIKQVSADAAKAKESAQTTISEIANGTYAAPETKGTDDGTSI